VVAQAQRLAQRQLQNLLGTWGERDLTGGDFLPRPDDPDNLRAYTLDARRLQHRRFATTHHSRSSSRRAENAPD
ncbi:MAG: hypothetical protein Q8K79_00080, partial [Solirubrobacteraceae bacterium]|nr:hypothetical protein [Solirubrobacteraceae bacterium]